MAGTSWTSSWSSVGESSRQLLSSWCVCVWGGAGWGCGVIKWLMQGTPGWEDTVCAVGAEGKFKAWISQGAGSQVTHLWGSAVCGDACGVPRRPWLPGVAAAAPGFPFSAQLVLNARVPAGPGQRGIIER